MTTDELRDELARVMGWRFLMDREVGPLGWEDPDGKMTLVAHPIPATLDGAASAMPEGWVWSKWGDGVYVAQKRNATTVLIEVEDTGNELHDRLALALAAHRTMKGTP